MAEKFIGYTIGLMAGRFGENSAPFMAKVEVSEARGGKIRLQVLSGRTLGIIPHTECLISREAYEDHDVLSSVSNAVWMLSKCGFEAGL